MNVLYFLGNHGNYRYDPGLTFNEGRWIFYFGVLLKLIMILFDLFCSPPVRRASANVVSIIAKYAVPTGEWPDLLPFLFQCSQSVQEDHREVSIYFNTIVG